MHFRSPTVGVGQIPWLLMSYTDKKRLNLCTKCSCKTNIPVRRENL